MTSSRWAGGVPPGADLITVSFFFVVIIPFSFNLLRSLRPHVFRRALFTNTKTIISSKGHRDIMSTGSVVFSIRIPQDLRNTMEEMKEVNWQEEIRNKIEELVRDKNKERILAEARLVRAEMKGVVKASELIRADRDER